MKLYSYIKHHNVGKHYNSWTLLGTDENTVKDICRTFGARRRKRRVAPRCIGRLHGLLLSMTHLVGPSTHNHPEVERIWILQETYHFHQEIIFDLLQDGCT